MVRFERILINLICKFVLSSNKKLCNSNCTYHEGVNVYSKLLLGSKIKSRYLSLFTILNLKKIMICSLKFKCGS